MNSTMIGKIEKAKLYAEQRDRIRFTDFHVTVTGNHRPHQVTFEDGKWTCDCETFGQVGYCSHTMAMERVLGPMIESVPVEAIGA